MINHPYGPPDETPDQRARRRARQLRRDLATLQAGHETGWWDHTGQPAPWPEDFYDHNTEWRPGTGPITPATPDEQPF
jgi:hypothetical protein